MARKTGLSEEIRAFILDQVRVYPTEITQRTAVRFGISRQAVSQHLRKLVSDGILEAEGNTKARRFKRSVLDRLNFQLRLFYGMPDDVIWRARVLPFLPPDRENVLAICQYGFTEILSNAADHSASDHAWVSIKVFHDEIEMTILDEGIGIFEKIRSTFGLSDPRHALLELSKGKLTSDPKRHSGEGIFFSSRMFNEFCLSSGGLYYRRSQNSEHEWLIETDDTLEHLKGTYVIMRLSRSCNITPTQIFARYQEAGNISFRKTHVPILLGKYPGEQLISRSQARRILTRFDRFSEVMLDFSKIEGIGQAFADEIFRVFANDHPDINVIYMNAAPAVQSMIEFVKSNQAAPQPDLFRGEATFGSTPS